MSKLRRLSGLHMARTGRNSANHTQSTVYEQDSTYSQSIDVNVTQYTPFIRASASGYRRTQAHTCRDNLEHYHYHLMTWPRSTGFQELCLSLSPSPSAAP